MNPSRSKSIFYNTNAAAFANRRAGRVQSCPMRIRRLFVPISLLAAFAFGAGPARGQLKIGQYEDEAPFRTWNTHPFTAASALGRGGTAFTLATDPSTALANPALLPLLPRFSVLVDGAFQTATFAKYGLVNTGIFTTQGNIDQSLTGLDFAGLSVRLGFWAFALSVSEAESYVRPQARYEEPDRSGRTAYLFQWNQTGGLKVLNFAVGRMLGGGLSLGLGLNYAFGSLRRDYVEQVYGPGGYRISDAVTQDFRGVFLNGGLLWSLTSKFRAAAVFRTPYAKKSQSGSDLAYTAPDGPTDITITATSDDTAGQPLVLGLGVSWDLLPNLVLAAEASFHNWSAYSLREFGEERDRAFRDVVKIGLGLEFRQQITLFGAAFDIPSRVGVIYDPQPMKDPASAYGDLTLGIGLAGKHVRLDLGALIGREWGSGDGLAARKIAISLGFQL